MFENIRKLEFENKTKLENELKKGSKPIKQDKIKEIETKVKRKIAKKRVRTLKRYFSSYSSFYSKHPLVTDKISHPSYLFFRSIDAS